MSSAAAAVVAYNTTGADRNLWLAGMGVILSVLPFTKIVMLSDIQALLNDNVIKEKGIFSY